MTAKRKLFAATFIAIILISFTLSNFKAIIVVPESIPASSKMKSTKRETRRDAPTFESIDKGFREDVESTFKLILDDEKIHCVYKRTRSGKTIGIILACIENHVKFAMFVPRHENIDSIKAWFDKYRPGLLNNVVLVPRKFKASNFKGEVIDEGACHDQETLGQFQPEMQSIYCGTLCDPANCEYYCALKKIATGQYSYITTHAMSNTKYVTSSINDPEAEKKKRKKFEARLVISEKKKRKKFEAKVRAGKRVQRDKFEARLVREEQAKRDKFEARLKSKEKIKLLIFDEDIYGLMLDQKKTSNDILEELRDFVKKLPYTINPTMQVYFVSAINKIIEHDLDDINFKGLKFNGFTYYESQVYEYLVNGIMSKEVNAGDLPGLEIFKLLIRIFNKFLNKEIKIGSLKKRIVYDENDIYLMLKNEDLFKNVQIASKVLFMDATGTGEEVAQFFNVDCEKQKIHIDNKYILYQCKELSGSEESLLDPGTFENVMTSVLNIIVFNPTKKIVIVAKNSILEKIHKILIKKKIKHEYITKSEQRSPVTNFMIVLEHYPLNSTGRYNNFQIMIAFGVLNLPKTVKSAMAEILNVDVKAITFREVANVIQFFGRSMVEDKECYAFTSRNLLHYGKCQDIPINYVPGMKLDEWSRLRVKKHCDEVIEELDEGKEIRIDKLEPDIISYIESERTIFLDRRSYGGKTRVFMRLVPPPMVSTGSRKRGAKSSYTR